MFKIQILIYLFMIIFFNIASASDEFKILVKVNNVIISNHDIKKEKNYLIALNPEIINISEDEIEEIAKQSIVREIIKEKEVSKYYDVDYDSPDLIRLARNLYTRLNINSEEEFKTYLTKYDLDLKDVLKKLAIEVNWNTLIYEKYKNQLSIDKVKIRKNLELEISSSKIEKLFLLSEIVFTAKDKEEYDANYQKIIDTIKQKNFRAAATIYSSSDTAKFGGEIGWMGKNEISEEIYKKVSVLKINEFSEPLKIGTGFMIINLDDTKEEKTKYNLEEKYNNLVSNETNRQLNQYSNIYFKRIQKKSFIYED